MRTLKEYIREREMRRTGGMPESADFHSKGYHRYFEGYSEYRVKKPNGRTKIERVYTGTYYSQEISPQQRIGIKIRYGACYLAAVMMFLFCATRYVPGNSCWYVAAAEAVSTVCLFWVLCTLVNYIAAGSDLTIYEYNSVRRLKKAAKWSAAALSCEAAVIVLYALLHFHDNPAAELPGAAASIVAAVSCLTIYMSEKRIGYRSFHSQNEVPAEAHQIEE